MNLNEELPASRVVKTSKIRTFSYLIIAIAAVLWVASMLMLIYQNNNLNNRLECQEDKRAELNEAIGRGLVAVSRDDSEELERQAKNIIQVVEEVSC